MEYGRLSYALRRWWYVWVACLLVSLTIAIIFVRVSPKEYTARADVMLAVSGRNAVDLSSGSNFAQQQARNLSVIATRQRVIDPVIRDLKLPQSSSELSQMVTATVPTNTSIVTLEITYPSADWAPKIANALADSLAETARELLPNAQTEAAVIDVRAVYQENPPTAPSSPSLTTATLLGLGGGFVLGLGLVLFLELILGGQAVARRADTPAQNSDPALSK